MGYFPITAASEKENDDSKALSYPVEGLLLEWVRLRACYIFGHSLGQLSHSINLKAQGVSAAKIAQVPFWRVSFCFDDKEKLAFLLVEILTSFNPKTLSLALMAAESVLMPMEIVELIAAVEAVREASLSQKTWSSGCN